MHGRSRQRFATLVAVATIRWVLTRSDLDFKAELRPLLVGKKHVANSRVELNSRNPGDLFPNFVK